MPSFKNTVSNTILFFSTENYKASIVSGSAIVSQKACRPEADDIDEENEEEVTNPTPAEAKKAYEILSPFATPQGFSYQTLQSLDEVGDAVNKAVQISVRQATITIFFKVHEFIFYC